MRSIFSTILLWGVATIGVSLVGYYATSRILDDHRGRPPDMVSKTETLRLDAARRALENGGPEELASYLRETNELLIGEHFLVDAEGKDLADGTDRSALLARASRGPRQGHSSGEGPGVLSRSSKDGRYCLLIVLPPMRRGGRDFLPYYLWILLVVALLGYGLAVHLARPLVSLRSAVDRFGRGELSTRIHWNRKDEIGELARSFDLMADRIETLMSAERRLLQDVSHELRSPLARLGFAIELARTGGDARLSLDRIKRDVDRLSSLVNALLQLTSAEGDPHSRNLRPVRLDELLQNLVDDCSVEADAKRCQLRLAEDGHPAVLGDAELLRRAVENVLRNAIRHAPEGTLIEVELRGRPDLATITIRDFGTGVPDEALGSIFKPFFRVDDDRSRTSGGVGLGLSIARRAIDLHRGRIEAENACPGLRVVIELPIFDSEIPV